MRYCGFLSLPRAVLRYSYPPYAPLLLRKDLLNWSLAEFFSHITDCHSCHKVCCLLSSAVLLLIKVHFFEEQVIGLHDLQKDHDLFLPFLHTRSATDDTWNMSALLRCLFVCMFFFYLLSSYKRAWGQHKACLGLKVIRHNQAKKEKQTKNFI